MVETIAAVRTNEFDLGIVPQADLPGELEFHPVETYRSYLIAPLRHPVAGIAEKDFPLLLNSEVLARYPLVVSETQQEIGTIRQALEQRGLPLNVGIEVGDMETLKFYVARGYGIGAVSGICLTAEDREKLEIVEIPEAYHSGTTYGVVMRKDKHVSNAVRVFLAAIGAE